MSPDDPRHGTEAGCREHYRQSVPPCSPCLDAHRKANIVRQLRPHKVSALGPQRRIRALQALGWGRDKIAAELGYSNGGSIAYLMRSETMLVATANRIAEVYDRLSMIVPVGAGPDRARTWAKRHGFAPPLAWDDIDDPSERPNLGEERRRDLLAEWRWLEAAGESIHQAARQLGVSVEAIEKAVEREKRAA